MIPFERRSPMQAGERNTNPTGVSFLELIREDFQTHQCRYSAPGFWALLVHRFGNLRMDVPTPARHPLTVAYNVAHRVVLGLWGIDMPYCVPIGRRLRICHHGGVHLGAWSVGDDVTIRHAVTVGVVGLAEHGDRSPTIGDRVELGPGAVVVGTVSLGDGAVIGANTVVLADVPAGAMALGVPARLVPRAD